MVDNVRLLEELQSRPAFEVTYPSLKRKRRGRQIVQEVTASTVLPQGIEWILAQIHEQGYVKPELE